MAENRQQLIYNAQRGAAEAWIMAQQYGTYYNASAMANAMNVLQPDEVPKDINFDQYWTGCGRAIVNAQSRLQNPGIYDSISTTEREDKEFLDNMKQIMKEHVRGAAIRECIAQGGYAEIQDRQELQARDSVFMLNQTNIETLAKKQERDEWRHDFHGISQLPEKIPTDCTKHLHSAGMAWDAYLYAMEKKHPDPKGATYGHVSSLLKNDAEEMANLVSIWEDALTLAKPELFADPDFVECALRYNSNAYAYLPPELQQKEEVVDIMRDVAFCHGGWLNHEKYEGAGGNRLNFIEGTPGAARLCPDNLMYSVKGYEHVAEYLLERQQRMGISPIDNGTIPPKGTALQFMATARQKFPELAKEFDAAEKRALATVQQRGKTPCREQPEFWCTLFKEKDINSLLFDVKGDVETAQYFNKYPAQLAISMAKLAQEIPLSELEKHFDVQKAWQGIGREEQKIELASSKEYTNMEKIRGVQDEHREFKKTMEQIKNMELPDYVHEMMKAGRDVDQQKLLDKIAEQKAKDDLQNKIKTMQRIMDGAKRNDTALKYNALELKDWMKKFDLPFLEQHLPIKEFWQSVGATVAQWEKELLTRQEKEDPSGTSTLSQVLKEDIDLFTKHMYDKHYQFIRENVEIGRLDAHAKDPEIVLDSQGRAQKAPAQSPQQKLQQEAKNRFQFYHGDDAKTQRASSNTIDNSRHYDNHDRHDRR